MERKIQRRKLTDISTICSYCGRILCGEESWEKKASDSLDYSHCRESHGICPDCLLENFPQEYLVIQEERKVRIKNIFKKGYLQLYGHLVK